MPGRAKVWVTAAELEYAVAGEPSSKNQLNLAFSPFCTVAVYETATPVTWGVVGASGSRMKGGRAATLQEKFTVALTVPSDTLSATGKSPAVVGVPVMRPLFRVKPGGSPSAENDSVFASGSDALIARSTGTPTVDA
jgi:hypothetical protein